MRAVVIREGGRAELEERPTATPSEGEMVLRVLASGLCGTDLWKLATGAAPAGTVLGHEIVGEVLALGAGVRGFEPGDRVVVPHHLSCGICRLCQSGAETQCSAFRLNRLDPGGFADQALVDAAATARAARAVPPGLDTFDALFLEPAACVLRSVNRASLATPLEAPGRTVALVLGGGSMGLLHLLVLRAELPGCDVVVVEPRADRRELALELGAAAALVPGDPHLADLGADAVFDCVGGGELAGVAIRALRPGGTAVLFAHARPGDTPAFDLNDLFKHEKRLVGAYSGSSREQARIFELLRSGVLRPSVLVSHRLPLTEFAHGVDLARRQEALKVVFEPGAS